VVVAGVTPTSATTGFDVARWDTATLAAEWMGARPFPHVIIDDALAAPDLDELRAALAQEPHWSERSEIVDGLASAPAFAHPVLVAFAAALASPATLDAVGAVAGKRVTRAEVRSYVYPPGGYLLPHTDNRRDIGRQIAFAGYVHDDGTCGGGELELFDCTMDGDEIVATASGRCIEPRTNRLVLFDVSPRSLHQIREITAGARIAFAGWFL
jgi:Rps23 Pro-64 3,4-dihydroxylase Tpa1-like proline 4-hydroxylase